MNSSNNDNWFKSSFQQPMLICVKKTMILTFLNRIETSSSNDCLEGWSRQSLELHELTAQGDIEYTQYSTVQYK